MFHKVFENIIDSCRITPKRCEENPKENLEQLYQHKILLDREMDTNRELIRVANYGMESLRREKRWVLGRIAKLKGSSHD